MHTDNNILRYFVLVTGCGVMKHNFVLIHGLMMFTSTMISGSTNDDFSGDFL